MSQKSISSLWHENRVFLPSQKFQQEAVVKSREEYLRLYERSLADPQGFWGEIAKNFYWHRPFTRVLEYSFGKDLFVRWFADGITNICYNALDRQVERCPDRAALLFVPNEGPSQRISYAELLARVCEFANVLTDLGVRRGDRVAIYMPMVPETVVAMLACARLGAIHNVVFGGFSARSLTDRILDSEASLLITANELKRGPKTIDLKTIADESLALCAKEGFEVKNCIVLARTDKNCAMKKGRDLWWHDAVKGKAKTCLPEWMGAEDPLFMLYTSGSTGKPKGVLHTIGGYMVYTAATFKYIFDHRDNDTFFCTADVGWVTGHSYLVYGPLLNGATSVLFEGVPNHPAPDRFWEIVEKEKVTVFYSAPTAIRALMREGEQWPKKHDLSSLRLLGTVGEPINPEAWVWYHEVIGNKNCPIVDTYWQTETGGILISPFPGAIALKPGAATVPFFGVSAKVVRDDGHECGPNEGGYLVIDRPWPGMMRTVYKDHKRFYDTYFTRFKNCYFTGDSARRDEDSYFWVMGRVDDVVNVSGHRLGTAEIESALVAHKSVSEAAVVGYPHEIKGQGIYAYVTLKSHVVPSAKLEEELREQVKKEIGAIARPDVLHFTPALPKTRSGKIMRRILRKVAAGDIHDLGDTTTLAEPHVVEGLLAGRQQPERGISHPLSSK